MLSANALWQFGPWVVLSWASVWAGRNHGTGEERKTTAEKGTKSSRADQQEEPKGPNK